MTDYTETAAMEDLHSPVVDTDEAIIVNVESKDFTFGPSFNPIIGVVGEHNAEMVSFAIDRYIDSHDISECAEHIVKWKNVDTGVFGEDTLKVKVSETDENKVFLGWLISDEVTDAAGGIKFALKISDYSVDGRVAYRWKTTDGTGLKIADTEFDEHTPSSIQKSFVHLTDHSTGKGYAVYISDEKLSLKESEG